MDNASYINISRQSGLLKELNTIANNLANSGTVGYKRETAVFSEYVNSLHNKGGSVDNEHSLSIGRLAAHVSHFESGELRLTGGNLDVALDGEGFFRVETPAGERLTRAGNFLTNQEGTIVTPGGYAVLDDAGGQIQIPPDVSTLTIGPDGTISADSVALGRFGVVTASPLDLSREGENFWSARQGVVPIEDPRMLQGYLEGSNVLPVAEIARMIEVQRYYDAGQKLMDMEDDRIKSVVSTVRQMT
ncbi:MAG: flagellar hook-basal body complex protein [Alphaproteobacteria bacterium]